MMYPRVLDLYCCQGGASQGYIDAGFAVVGVDLYPQPRYPWPFDQADAIEYVLEYGAEFELIHASPPCQLYSKTHRINRSEFPDLIGPTRDALDKVGVPYVIENVVDAASELLEPVELCGSMFGIETYRHRLFETTWKMEAPPHPEHIARTTKMGRAPVDGQYMHIVGNFSGTDRARSIMGMPWANRDGLREAIPPVYSEYVGRSFREATGL